MIGVLHVGLSLSAGFFDFFLLVWITSKATRITSFQKMKMPRVLILTAVFLYIWEFILKISFIFCIFIITTDGYENASYRYSSDKVKRMIEHEKEKYGWEFLFIGANIDSVMAWVKNRLKYRWFFVILCHKI